MKETINKLFTEIEKYNLLYRQGTPAISDFEYDQLVGQLKRLAPGHKWFQKIEPSPVSSARKVKLPIPMKSLEKVKDVGGLQAWAKSTGLQDTDLLVITPKFDGLSLLRDEQYNKVYSRGGAENEGQDCSEHWKAMQCCDMPGVQFTFGEFVFSCRQWNTHFAGKKSPDTGKIYKSPRNTAAGLLNRDLPDETLRYVDFYRYGIDSKALNTYNTYQEAYTALSKSAKQPNLSKTIMVKDLTRNLMSDLFNEFSKEYYIDGLVVYANDLAIWNKVGRHTTTGNPKYAIAYKDPDFTERFVTTVKDITWNISKAGAFKPVVNIDTVDVGDCEIENPTGYNAKYIKAQKLGVGAEIQITRSGGVIPKITSVINPASQNNIEKMWEDLKYCPKCGKPTHLNSTGVDLCCDNPKCPGIVLAKIIFFYKTVGVENMGEETIATIFNNGFNSLRRILNIQFEDLMRIDGFGETTANIILANNRVIKKGVPVVTLMHASDCFHGIGEVKAQKILESMTVERCRLFCEGMLITSAPEYFNGSERLSKTEESFRLGVQPFYDFVAENELIILPPVKHQPSSDKYSQYKICFTGVRDKGLEDAIREGGGQVVNSVSKNTTHLITADVDGTSSKANKARKYEIPIVTLADFKKLL